MGAAATAALAWAVVCACEEGSSTAPVAPVASEPATDGRAPYASSAPGVDSSTPNLAKILSDETLWGAVPNSGGCDLRAATLSAEPFPKRVWTSCGAGCRTADWAPRFDIPTSSPTLSPTGQGVGNDLYIYGSMNSSAGSVTRLERLSDEKTLAATFDRKGNCLLPNIGGVSPFLVAQYDSTTHLHRFGRSYLDGRAISWQPGWTSLGSGLSERFDSTIGFGVGSGGGPLVFADFSGGQPAPLSGAGTSISGSSGAIVWAGLGSTIYSASSLGQKPLVALQAPRRVLMVRHGGSRVVWISGSPMAENDARSTDVRWQRASPDGVLLLDGPSLPLTIQGNDLAVGSAWAALSGCSADTEESCKVWGWNSVTGAVFELPNRPGHLTVRILGISDKEILLAEGSTTVDSLVLVDLANVGPLAQAWNK